ncbi:hypothetical protein ACYATP_07760 [Lactobacillaceae bacterium Melli_B4]
MNSTTGFEMATAVQLQMRKHFSWYQVDQIQIIENNDEPKIKISLVNKLNHQPATLILVAEQQETNPNNVHLSLFDCDQYFTNLYRTHRTSYVQRNHELASAISDQQLVPENLYLIQDADGKPGVDFIKLTSICDAINLLTTVSDLFKH